MKWQLQQAKAQFSEVVRRAATEGPQIVTCRGVDTAVVLSAEEYARLKSKRPNFVEHLLAMPKLDDDIVDTINERSRDTGRDIDLC